MIATGEQRPAIVSEHRAGLVRAAGVGGLLLPIFAVLDVYLHTFLFPASDLTLILALRLVAITSAVVAWRVGRDVRHSDRAALATHVICIGTVGAALALMGVQLGGPNSPYFHGLTLIILIRSGAVPERFWVSAAYGAGLVVIWGAVMGTQTFRGAALFTTEKDGFLFLANAVLVCASCAGGPLVSHVSFRAREQVYKARRLGRFRLEAPIGHGGQNEVWLAWDPADERQVAVKILRRARATQDAIRLFEREAQIARSLTNEHSVRVYDFGSSDDGIFYLAMEYVDGADLAKLVRDHGPFSAARTIHAASQACLALEEAHERGLVHRDVKPANLMFLRRAGSWDSLRVLDYGIARPLQPDTGSSTETGLRGTPAYLAPEAWAGSPATAAADIYGLAPRSTVCSADTPPSRARTSRSAPPSRAARRLRRPSCDRTFPRIWKRS